jgi:hypothetical protein
VILADRTPKIDKKYFSKNSRYCGLCQPQNTIYGILGKIRQENI